MNQMNILPIDMQQVSDQKSEKLSLGNDGATKEDNFSKLLAQHVQTEAKDKSTKNKIDEGGNKSSEDESLGDDSASSELNKSMDSSTENSAEMETDNSVNEEIKTNALDDNDGTIDKLEESAQFIAFLNASDQMLQKDVSIADTDTDEALSRNDLLQKNASGKGRLSDYEYQKSLQVKQSIIGESSLDADMIKSSDNVADLTLLVEQAIKNAKLKDTLVNNDKRDTGLYQNPVEPSIDEENIILDEQLNDGEITQTKIDEEPKKTNQKSSDQSLLMPNDNVNKNNPLSNAQRMSALSEKSSDKRQPLINDALPQNIKKIDASELNGGNGVGEQFIDAADLDLETIKNRNSDLSKNIENSDGSIQTVKEPAQQLGVFTNKLNSDERQVESLNLNKQAMTSADSDKSKVFAQNTHVIEVSKSSDPMNQSSTKIMTESLPQSSSDDSASSNSEQQNRDTQEELLAQEFMTVGSGDNEENTHELTSKQNFSINNTEPLARHTTDVSGQATKVAEQAAMANTIENTLNALNSENITQEKESIKSLNETISIFRKDFAEAVKEKIMVIISQKLQQFDIRLDPPELGSVHARVNLQNEQAVVNFVVQNQQAKEAFEQNLDKLKMMLAESGVDVADASVEQQASESETNQNEQGNEQSNSHDGDIHNLLESSQNDSKTVLSANLFETSATSVDYYA